MKRFIILMAVCLAFMQSSFSLASGPAGDGLHLQIEPMYIGVTGLRENLGDLANQGTPLIVDPNNDLRLRGEISYRRGNWRVGANGWYFNTDYELVVVGAAPLAENLAQTKVSFWSGGPFIDYKIFGVGEKELFVHMGAKFSQSQQRLWGFQNLIGVVAPSNTTISYANVNFMYGPSIGLKGQMSFLKNFWLQGFLTQTLSFGRVQRDVFQNRLSVASSSDTVCMPISEAYLKVSYYFTPNIGVGLGGLLSVWYAVPVPLRPLAPGQWKKSEKNLLFSGLTFAVEGKW